MTKISKMTNRRPLRVLVLAAWLVGTGLALNLAPAQDVKVNIGSGENSEEAKQNQELANKLPPQEQAAYLKRHETWSWIGTFVQIAASVGLPLGIVALVLTFRHRRQKLVHETMRL